jgi:cellulose synthase/poly-beta-1,6-N-acetylglucosamine synthase-like glycosyltransferase
MAAIYLVLIFTCLIQIVFYALIFSKYLFDKKSAAKISIDSFKPTSIVICAKNEFKNLSANLLEIIHQAFPTFEIIVIDDGSTDETPQLLQSLEEEYSNFFGFRIEEKDKSHPGKKQALQYGISLAKYEHIVVTDADCIPASREWLQYMTAPLHDTADVVLGVSPFLKTKSLANLFFRAEAFFVALQYINFTLSGLPFMGVGRNMAYKKKVFNQHDFSAHWDLTSGDDDLFISDVSSEFKIEVVTHPQSYTYSPAPKNLKGWFNQKLRHYSAGYRYELIQKVWLGYYWLSSLLLYLFCFILPVLFLFGCSISKFSIILLLATTLLRWYITGRSLHKLAPQNFNLSVPLMDFLYILSVWIVSPISTIIKHKWK